MSLFEPQQIARFRREVEANTYSVFINVPISNRFFEADGGVADLLCKLLNDRSGYLLLIDDGVRYVGPDVDLIQAFGNPAQNGWRPLTVITEVHAEAALRRVDAVLGLDGEVPGLAQRGEAGLREVVVPADELVSNDEVERENDEERFGRDLVAEARACKLEPPLFREAEIDALTRITSKAGKNAACLVGPPGVGKTAIVEGLAIAIAQQRVPGSLRNVRLLDVNLSFLAAGAIYQNEFAGRMKKLLDLARRDRDVILFLDELHTLRTPSSDASQMVKSDLGRGRIRCIGATTNSEYRLIEADPALARRFQVVPVQELTPAQSLEILRVASTRFAHHHSVTIPIELLEQIVDLSVRYVPDRQLPDKALDLLDEACACARIGDLQPTAAQR